MASDDMPTRRGEGDDYLTQRGLAPAAKVFGRYRLEAVAGRGGMGVVWKAFDEDLQRTVALKVLADTVAGDPDAVEELKRETRHCLELTHPNIVRVYDFVHDHRGAAIAMEFVEGETLARRRAAAGSGCLDVGELTPLVGQLCAALAYAHTKARVVHRDLKPSNLLVTAAGELKVSDFGVARSLAEMHTRLTGRTAGATSGTLPYMSPQQVLGRKPTVADDIYSLGATLYDLLTGRPPFHRGEADSLMLQIRENPPLALAAQRAELETTGAPIPRAWEDTILACLAKEPERRPQSAGEVARRLGVAPELASVPPVSNVPGPSAAPVEAVRPGTPPAVAPLTIPGEQRPSEHGESREPPQTATPRSRGRWPVVAAAAALILALAGYLFWRGRGPATAGQRGFASLAEAEAANPDTAVGAEKLPKPQTGRAWTVPDLNLPMAYIPPGTFLMGSPGSEEDRYDDEGPQTRVKLTRGYWLGKTEVTQRQWQALMGNNPASFKGADRPVEQVSWTGAMEFCRKLTESERAAGRLPDGYAYTLPTEAQWEYGCRAGTSGPWAGSGNLDEMAWYNRNSGKATQPVAQKQPNAWGLNDMHGNVREWCLDWYGSYAGGSVTDPAGPSSGSLRTNRGGDWNNGPRFCRSADRGALKPDARFPYLGFRLALAPQASQAASKTTTTELKPPEELPAARAKPTYPKSGQLWENTLGMKFAPVPGTGVWFCLWETRVQDFAAFVEATGYGAAGGTFSLGSDGWKQRGNTWRNPGFSQGPTHPVCGVSWDDAKAFCRWLTEKERRAGRLSPNQEYRLPTDAEWSAAVGLDEPAGGTPQSKDAQIKGVYPWGTQWPPPRGAGNFAGTEVRDGNWPSNFGVIEGYSDGYPRTAPVGSFTANRYGLYDLSGNVWQWCEDFFNGSNGPRVLRGGSFGNCEPDDLLSSYRIFCDPGRRYDYIGFRLALAPSP